MKKNLILTLALAGIMSLASCQSEEPAPQSGDEVVVTFKAQIPQEIQSRSFADGTTAQNLKALLYQKQDDGSYVYVTETAATLENKAAEVKFSFIKGHTYAVIFWAQAEGAPYTIDKETAKIAMHYTADGTVANDETRDAFYKRQDDITASEDTEIKVTLKRPFAQLNIGTNDLSAAKSAGYEYTDAIVTVGTYDSMDLLTGEVEGDMIPVTFSQAAFPEDQVFPVTGDSYCDYLSMNYLLISEKQELSKVDVTLIPGAESQLKDSKELSYDYVPLSRNYRTNIYGSLLTSSATYKVKVDENFSTPDYDNYVGVANGEDMYKAMQKGLKVILSQDVETYHLQLCQSKVPATSTLDLNGHTVTVMGSTTQRIEKGCDLTLKDGTIKFESKSIEEAQPLFRINDGTLTLQNVDITCAGACIDANDDKTVLNITNSTINTKSYGVTTNASTNHKPTINIDNSTITGLTPLLINVEAEVTLKNCTFIGTVQGAILRGGTYTMASNYFILDITNVAAGSYDDYISSNWGSGNQAPRAALVIGNRSTAYQYATKFDKFASNRALITTREDGEDQYYRNVYVYANPTEGIGVYFPSEQAKLKMTLTADGYSTTSRGIVYASSNIWGPSTEYTHE